MVLERRERGWVLVILTLTIGSVILSAAMAYVIGRAFIAEEGSFLRTKTGIWMLVVGALSFLFLPPQVVAMTSVQLPDSVSLPGVTDVLATPAGYSATSVYAGWVLTSIAAWLLGAEIWRAGKPGWRPGSGSNIYDRSPAGRAAGLFPLQDTLDGVAEVIARVRIDPKGVVALAPALEEAGRRLALTMPADSSGVYRVLVDNGVPTPVAGPATRHLIEGAKRGR
jgi:hypothetical protein